MYACVPHLLGIEIDRGDRPMRGFSQRHAAAGEVHRTHHRSQQTPRGKPRVVNLDDPLLHASLQNTLHRTDASPDRSGHTKPRRARVATSVGR